MTDPPPPLTPEQQAEQLAALEMYRAAMRLFASDNRLVLLAYDGESVSVRPVGHPVGQRIAVAIPKKRATIAPTQ